MRSLCLHKADADGYSVLVYYYRAPESSIVEPYLDTHARARRRRSRRTAEPSADAGLYTNNFPVRILEDSSASENDRCLLVPFKTASNIKDKRTVNCGCVFGSDGRRALTTVHKGVTSSSTHSNTPAYLDICLLPFN